MPAEKIDYSQYDYLDFGCSSGNSIPYGVKKFGGTAGIGIDIDEKKVAQARKRIAENEISSCHAVMCEDIRGLRRFMPRRHFRFITCIHFMEHLWGIKDVQQVLFAATCFAKEFVFVLQPNADKNQYLFEKGLKTYYSDWTSHTALLTSYDFFRLCRSFKETGAIRDFVIFQAKPIKDSSDPLIHPLASPREQKEYDPAVHPPKEEGVPLENVYRDIGLFLFLTDDVPVDRYMEKVAPDRSIIYDSRTEDK